VRAGGSSWEKRKEGKIQGKRQKIKPTKTEKMTPPCQPGAGSTKAAKSSRRQNLFPVIDKKAESSAGWPEMGGRRSSKPIECRVKRKSTANWSVEYEIRGKEEIQCTVDEGVAGEL